MSERPSPVEDPEQILQLKNQMMELWQQLPAMHQATMALVLFADVVDSTEYGQWLREATKLCRPEGRDDKPDPSDLPML